MSETETFKRIDPREFLSLDLDSYTLVDLREPDEVLIGGIDGAMNVPFSRFYAEIDNIPRDKPVLVFCRVGDWSEEFAEILSDRGYDVTHLEGGYNALRKLKEGVENVRQTEATQAESFYIDAKGIKCPGPIVKTADFLRTFPVGTKVVVEATEDAFYSDIRVWCERTGNSLASLSVSDGVIRAEIVKSTRQAHPSSDTRISHGKTFVLFSGDLDKTIAAFIMANGAASMGREVTMFFTFWGLNILRRPERIAVNKTFIEKMFGALMPRGTKKLGLSRMNMGGAGGKMIRVVMKKKGISSLEELIDSAISHGVRIVACQMSMDIMGITREELIDGVELGGVTTFLGSGENSDMSLFI